MDNHGFGLAGVLRHMVQWKRTSIQSLKRVTLYITTHSDSRLSAQKCWPWAWPTRPIKAQRERHNSICYVHPVYEQARSEGENKHRLALQWRPWWTIMLVWFSALTESIFSIQDLPSTALSRKIYRVSRILGTSKIRSGTTMVIQLTAMVT